MRITRRQLRKIIAEAISLPDIEPRQDVYDPSEEEIEAQDE